MEASGSHDGAADERVARVKPAPLGPPGKALLIMAHYDSVPGSPGAVDNGSPLEDDLVGHEQPRS